MPKLSNITFDEYATIQAIKYPSLYGNCSFEGSKLAILDHLLSTLGNGISFDDLLVSSKRNKVNKELLSRPYKHLFDGTPMYYIRKKDPELRHERLTNPEDGSEVFTLTMDDIQRFGWDNPDEYHWFENHNSSKDNPNSWRPYPNFSKNYSIIWENKEELHLLPLDFLKAFVGYYNITLDFFSTDKQYLYSYACPRPDDEKAWEKALVEWDAIYKRTTEKIVGEQEKMAHFSKSYEQIFDGDMRSFLENRHAKIIQDAIDFIKDVLELLEKVITEKEKEKK